MQPKNLNDNRDFAGGQSGVSAGSQILGYDRLGLGEIKR